MSDGGAAAERLAWLTGVLRDPLAVTPDEFTEAYDTTEWGRGWTAVDELEEIRGDTRLVRPFAPEAPPTFDGDGASVVLVGADAKRWALRCWVHAEPPHRITGSRLLPAPPEGMSIRNATEADAEALAELERRSPLRLGEGGRLLMTFDRGDDYFASARLMEDVTVYLAEVAGSVAGVYWGALQPVLVDGEPKRLFLEHHVRIDPETARGGVFWALCNYGRDAYARTADTIAFYVSPDNFAVRKFVEGVPSWSVQPLRALMRCASGSSGPIGRVATPADAELIAEVLNTAHRGEELFVPYTADSLTARLERSPDQYTWSSLRIGPGDAAVVGVGASAMTVTKEHDGVVERTCRASVLDAGFVPGEEETFRGLLGAWGAELTARGVSHLALFTSAGTAAHDVAVPLAEIIEPFDFWAFDLEEPPRLAANGFYVDPVYF